MQRVRQIVLLVTLLLHKYEDLSSFPQHSFQKAGMVMCASNLGAVAGETEEES